MPESQSDERDKALQAAREEYESEVRARSNAVQLTTFYFSPRKSA